MRLSLAIPILALALCTTTRRAGAQPARVDGRGWDDARSMDPTALPHTESTLVPGHGAWDVGAFTWFHDRPYAMRDPRTALVAWQLGLDAVVQVGLARNMAVALDLPVLLAQGGDVSPLGWTALDRSSLGDLRLQWRWTTRAVRRGRAERAAQPAGRAGEERYPDQGPGLATVVEVSVPTGNPQAFMGNGAVIVHPRVVGDFRLLGLVVAGSLGYRARIDGAWPAQRGVCTGADAGIGIACLGGTELHDAITWSVGGRLPQELLGRVAELHVEAAGWIDARNPVTGSNPVEVGGGFRRTLGRAEHTLALGAWAGVTDAPGLPRVRVLLSYAWSPRFVDEDEDGLRDDTGEDHCPGMAEDRDGFEDGDGCPEDNDQDLLPDAEDRCPSQNEDEDGFQDDDGCPDPDNDTDGVLDTEDACPDTAAGTRPDPARRGCPATAPVTSAAPAPAP